MEHLAAVPPSPLRLAGEDVVVVVAFAFRREHHLAHQRERAPVEHLGIGVESGRGRDRAVELPRRPRCSAGGQASTSPRAVSIMLAGIVGRPADGPDSDEPVRISRAEVVGAGECDDAGQVADVTDPLPGVADVGEEVAAGDIVHLAGVHAHAFRRRWRSPR